LAGALLLSFGIAAIADPSGVAGFIAHVPGVANMAVVINIPEVILSCAIFMIVLGSVMLVFGFLGCAGAAFTSKPLLFLYWILLIVTLIAEVALIIYAAVSPRAAEQQIQSVMIASLHKNFNTVTISTGNKTVTLPSNVVAVSWVAMQSEVACCGVYNYTDYSGFPWNNNFTLIYGGQSHFIEAVVPPSCCVLKQKNIVPKSTDDYLNLPDCLQGISSYNTVGCYKAVVQLAKQFSYIPIAICSVVIAIEIVCIITSVYLWRTPSKKIE